MTKPYRIILKPFPDFEVEYELGEVKIEQIPGKEGFRTYRISQPVKLIEIRDKTKEKK